MILSALMWGTPQGEQQLGKGGGGDQERGRHTAKEMWSVILGDRGLA